jgi:hypothetical protein
MNYNWINKRQAQRIQREKLMKNDKLLHDFETSKRLFARKRSGTKAKRRKTYKNLAGQSEYKGTPQTATVSLLTHNFMHLAYCYY